MLTYRHYFFQTKASGRLWLAFVVQSTHFFAFGCPWTLRLFEVVALEDIAFAVLVVFFLFVDFVCFVVVCVALTVVVFVALFVLFVFEVAFDNIAVAVHLVPDPWRH